MDTQTRKTALTASAWIKLGIHGLPPTDGIGQNVWQDVKKKNKNLRMVMLLRKKVILTLLLYPGAMRRLKWSWRMEIFKMVLLKVRLIFAN